MRKARRLGGGTGLQVAPQGSPDVVGLFLNQIVEQFGGQPALQTTCSGEKSLIVFVKHLDFRLARLELLGAF